MIFEDARAGFEAARRAGAGRIVALTTTLPREELERGPLADRIIDSFADIADIGAGRRREYAARTASATPEPAGRHRRRFS